MAASAPASGPGISGLSPALWEEAGWLVCELTVELPVSNFTVGDLLQLSVGLVLETQWKNSDDMPLRANKRQIAWAECEASGESLGIRLTELL